MIPINDFNVWMEQHKGAYLNNFAIVIVRKPQFLFVDSPWPGHADAITLSICLICTEVKELFETLNIEKVNDLERLQPEDLLHLFYNGYAMLFCRIGEHQTLQFQKMRKAMIAWIDGEATAHTVQEQLIVAGDFISYTEEYFRRLNNLTKGANKK